MHLELQKLSKTFIDRRGEEVAAVRDFSLGVRWGEFVCLVGPSGCGKTTVLRMVAGLETPTAGHIFLDGRDITRMPVEKRGMAVVFQHYALFPHMNVFHNVAFGLSVRGRPRDEIAQRVTAVLEAVGLSGLEKRTPAELSGGQQQRVALARALVVEPSVLLCDEPLSNLDAQLRVQLRGELKAIRGRLEVTTLYVTHDEDEAAVLADRIVRMG